MIEYQQFELDNGLRVVVNRDTSTARAAVNILYNVGARDEDSSLTGLAHLFEHLMFGGSVNIPDFDAAIERAGGWNNAWTNNDFTNFYCVLPAENIETAFWLESDRMLSLAFTEKSLEVQRSVVIEEFKQVCLNKPYGDLGHHLLPLIYTTHPYRYPTIGITPDHIAAVTMDDVRQFFYSHYAPNNAVLAVSGNVEVDRIKALAEKWFGSIPRRPIKPPTYLPEPPITSQRRKVVEANVPQTQIVIAFPMCAYGDEDYIAADLITDILASGRSSRFYRRLVLGNELFAQADASISGSDEPGYLRLQGSLTANDTASIEAAEAAIFDEALSLTRSEISHEELDCAINQFESKHTFTQINYVAKASTLAMAVMQGEDVNTLVERYRRTTPAEILRVARKILNPQHCAVLIYRPKSEN